MEVAAGAIAFATVLAQLGNTAFKLHRAWENVVDVPDKVRYLLDDIDHVRLLFADIETSIKNENYPDLPPSFWAGPLMQQSLRRAKQALIDLETVIEDLDTRLTKKRQGVRRKLVAMRGLMDMEKIQKLEEKLDRSVTLLCQAHNV